MDSQWAPWTACVEGKLPVVFCYNLGMTLEIGSEVTEKGKGLQGSQHGLLEGVAYGWAGSVHPGWGLRHSNELLAQKGPMGTLK